MGETYVITQECCLVITIWSLSPNKEEESGEDSLLVSLLLWQESLTNLKASFYGKRVFLLLGDCCIFLFFTRDSLNISKGYIFVWKATRFERRATTAAENFFFLLFSLPLSLSL